MATPDKLSITYQRNDLIFKNPAGTSRGVLTFKPTWFIEIIYGEKRGRGEISLIPGLSLDDETGVEPQLQIIRENLQHSTALEKLSTLFADVERAVPVNYTHRLALIADFLDHCRVSVDGAFPAIRFAMEMAILEMLSPAAGVWFESDFIYGRAQIPINGLIWMGGRTFMEEQIEVKLAEGFSCLKMKIGAMGFDSECAILESIRKRFTRDKLELRVDANGAFSPEEAPEVLKTLSAFDLHSIEQPIKQGQWRQMRKLCENAQLAIALDEELIGVTGATRTEMLQAIGSSYIILKPSLLGGFHFAGQWLEIATKLGIHGWVTSALESNLGLAAIAQWTALYNFTMPQGLGTGKLFTNNLSSNLTIENGHLMVKQGQS